MPIGCSPGPGHDAPSTGRWLGGAHPGLGSSEYPQAQIAAQMQEIPVRGHFAAVGVSVSRVVEMSAARVLRIDLQETLTDPQSAEATVAQPGVGIARVGADAVTGRELGDLDT